MVKTITLQDGEEIFVDDIDYERVNQYTWYKEFLGNSRRIRTVMFDTKKSILLSTFILKESFQKVKNNDFTRSNLTTKGNKNRWSKGFPGGSSKYKGVYWLEKRKKWGSSIRVNGKTKFLGVFESEDKAAQEYNNAVDNYWDGEGYKNVIGKDNRISINTYITVPNKRNRRSKLLIQGD